MVDRAALVVEERDEMIALGQLRALAGTRRRRRRLPGRRPAPGTGHRHPSARAPRGHRPDQRHHPVHGRRARRQPSDALRLRRAGWPVHRRFESGVVDLDWPLEDTDEFLDSVERREQRADSRAVARLLMPRTIAVVGASDRPGSIGEHVFSHVVAGARGAVYPINPAHTTVGGQPAFPSIVAVPDDVHLAIVVVPASALAATIEDCIAARVRGAVVITSVEGSDLDVTALVARARRHGVRIIGPGSMGVAASRPEVGLNAALVPVSLPPGPVAISMQSGSLGASVLRLTAQLGMGLSWFVSLGDKRDISANDLLQFWEDDEHTRVIAMYTETFGNPRKFARIARRVSQRRPIVAVRTGAAATMTTGSALYQQAGLIEVPTVRSLLDTTRVLATQPIPAGPHVAVLSNSRSPAILAEAALVAVGLEVVERDHGLDFRSGATDFARALRAALADDGVDAVLVIHAPPLAEAVAAPVAELDDAAAGATKPVLAVLLGAGDGPLRRGSPVPAFAFPEPAAGALGRAHAYGQWLASEAAAESGSIADIDRPLVAGVIAAALADGREELGAVEAAAVLGGTASRCRPPAWWRPTAPSRRPPRSATPSRSRRCTATSGARSRRASASISSTPRTSRPPSRRCAGRSATMRRR